MDSIKTILSIISEIYKLVENVKANEKRCHRVYDRVKMLEELVRSIQPEKTIQTSADMVQKALMELCITLESAQAVIKKYTETNWFVHCLRSNTYKEEFSSVNKRLDDGYQVLFGALHVEHRDILHKLHQLAVRDEEEDIAELKRLNEPTIINVDIREIKPDELKYNHPKRPFMVTSNSEVYKGEYHGFPVAIKRYIDLVNTNSEEVMSVFKRETDTMKRFESPNILRMFGICIQDENGPNPQYLIIMEYCEKGSLRQVLDSDCHLTWTMKACMCLDAARGLYRLHQTEEKGKVHGCINSSKFMVAEGYTVKLGGFELAKTESSLRRTTKDKETRTLCYSSPQLISIPDHVYSKECEIYSFGIVMWEIATGKKPFEDLSNKEIYQKVCREKYQEELPADCPEALTQLINACRAYDSFQRPSAGVLMDQLCIVAAHLEEQ